MGKKAFKKFGSFKKIGLKGMDKGKNFIKKAATRKLKLYLFLGILILSVILCLWGILWYQLNTLNVVSNAGMLLLMEEEEALMEDEDNRGNWWDGIEFDRVGAGEEDNLFGRPDTPLNDDYTIPNGVYPSDPELKLKAQIIELVREIAAYKNIQPEDLFAVFYAEHGATVHYSGNIPDIYSTVICAAEYSDYFSGGDINLGMVDTTASIKYGPMGIPAADLATAFSVGYNAKAIGTQGTFTASVMSNTGQGDFARPHPLYLPDAMYYVACKLADSYQVEITGGTTDYANIDFKRMVLSGTASGATAEMINAAIDERVKNHAGGKTSLLTGKGSVFLKAEQETGVNALVWLAIAVNESGAGTSNICKMKNNFYGWGAVDDNPMNGAWSYATVDEGIVAVPKAITANYINKRKQDTLYKIEHDPNGTGYSYASDKEWDEKAEIHLKKIYNTIATQFTPLPVNGKVSVSGTSYLAQYSASTLDSGRNEYKKWLEEIYNVLVDEGKVVGKEPSTPGGGSGSGTKLTVEQQNAIRANALTAVGKPYVYGDKGPNSFDCSGLVIWTYKTSNVALSYSGNSDFISANMRNSSVRIGWDELQIGDLIFKHTGSNEGYMTVHHVVIYVGNGECVDASSTKTGVVKRDVSYYRDAKDSHLYSVGRPKAYYQESTGTGTESGFGGIDGAQWPMSIASVTSVTSQFGWRAYSNNIHGAIDFAAARNTPLYPILDGMKVVKNEGQNGYGHVVVLSKEHNGQTLYVKYNHLNSAAPVSVGSIVNKNTIVGYVGGTTYSSSTGKFSDGYGMHLDWEFFIGGGGTTSTADKAYKAHPFEPLGYNPYQTREWRYNWLKSVGLNKFECNAECNSQTSWNKNFPEGYWLASCPTHWASNMEILQARENASTVRKPTLYK